jgi:hypothetical protein
MLDLPVSLTVQLLQDWLSLKDLAALDRVECNRASRVAYCNVLKSECFHVSLDFQITGSLMQWIVDRSVQVTQVLLDFGGPSKDRAVLASFLACVGPNLFDLAASNSKNNLSLICCLAIASCPRLKVLYLVKSNGTMAAEVRTLIAKSAPDLANLRPCQNDARCTCCGI